MRLVMWLCVWIVPYLSMGLWIVMYARERRRAKEYRRVLLLTHEVVEEIRDMGNDLIREQEHARFLLEARPDESMAEAIVRRFGQTKSQQELS